MEYDDIQIKDEQKCPHCGFQTEFFKTRDLTNDLSQYTLTGTKLTVAKFSYYDNPDFKEGTETCPFSVIYEGEEEVDFGNRTFNIRAFAKCENCKEVYKELYIHVVNGKITEVEGKQLLFLSEKVK